MSAKDYYVFTGTVYVKDPDTIIAQGMEFTKVVRCRDCKYCDSESELKPGYMYCIYHGSYQYGLDGFCKWGERDA